MSEYSIFRRKFCVLEEIESLADTASLAGDLPPPWLGMAGLTVFLIRKHFVSDREISMARQLYPDSQEISEGKIPGFFHVLDILGLQ